MRLRLRLSEDVAEDRFEREKTITCVQFLDRGEADFKRPLLGEPCRRRNTPTVAVHSRCSYYPANATDLAAHRPACGTLLCRSQYHPAHTGCDGGRQNRMDSIFDRMPSHACGFRVDRMGLDRHGLCSLWNGGIGSRPCYSHEHSDWTGGDRRPLPLQCDQRGGELFPDPVRRERIFPFVSGQRASSIPPSQSSVPFFIRKTLTRSNPASISQTFVAAAE